MDQRLLLGLICNLEHDDVAVALAAVRVDGIGSGFLKKMNDLPPTWQTGLSFVPTYYCHARHHHGEPVYVLDARGTKPVRHSSSVHCVHPRD